MNRRDHLTELTPQFAAQDAFPQSSCLVTLPFCSTRTLIDIVLSSSTFSYLWHKQRILFLCVSCFFISLHSVCASAVDTWETANVHGFCDIREVWKKIISTIKSTSVFVCICSYSMEHCGLISKKLLSAIYDKTKSEFFIIRGTVSNSLSILSFFN